MDGVGAGIYEALTPLLIADVMRGTGRYNFAQGAVATTQGGGVSVSALAVGEAMDHFGYSATFFVLAAGAGVAFLVFFAFMPETRDEQAMAHGRDDAAAVGAPGE